MDTIVVDGGGYRHWAKRSSDSGQRAEQLGILVASGLIAGESLFGVMLAAVIVARSTAAPLAIVGEGFPYAPLIAPVSFMLLMALLYRWKIQRLPPSPSSRGRR
jgi:hypothetical protein